MSWTTPAETVLATLSVSEAVELVQIVVLLAVIGWAIWTLVRYW